MPEAILTATDITKRFGGLLALDQVNFSVPRGGIVGLIGPNGAGKTTLFNILTGFYRPDGGDMYFRGIRYNAFTPDRIAALGISRTFQNIRLFAEMTSLENVLVGHHLHIHTGFLSAILRTDALRREEKRAEKEALEVLDFVGIHSRHDDLARNLPYGEQRKLEIARALATRPGLLLLDEPTAGMNPTESREMIALIRRLRDEQGVSVILIEHQMRVVMDVCERITVLDYGRKIADGSPEEIRIDPHVIEAYLGKGAVTADGSSHP